MKPRRFHGANKVFSLPGGNEDNDLWVRQMTVLDETIGEQPCIVSVYVPTDAERQRIADGANVEVTIVGIEQPPIIVATTFLPLGKGSTYFWAYRDDGWPLCPHCGEDELWSNWPCSPAEVAESGELDEPARKAKMVATIVGCYACDWKPERD